MSAKTSFQPFLKPLATTLGAAALLALAAMGSAHADEEKVLNVYNWSNYIAPDTVANFEKETGIKVRYDVFDSNEIVHAKLVAGKTGYDIVVPSSYWAKMQADGGLLQKVDKSKLPNLKNIDPGILAQLARLDPGNQYMVNWMWGYTTVGINVDKVKAALGDLPMPDNAWDLVFKVEYISRLKSCGVSFLDSPTEVVPAALHYLGKPAYSKTAADYAVAAEMLKKVRPTVSRYVGNLETQLNNWGSTAKLNLLRSDGGLMSAEKSRAAPVNLLMSGPAGGVAADGVDLGPVDAVVEPHTEPTAMADVGRHEEPLGLLVDDVRSNRARLDRRRCDRLRCGSS